ncbi:helix-turn-helix domain-containing protein, partial [Planomonospora parontospora]
MSEHTTTSADLGRRVAARRGELGLSRKQLAGRTGIDSGYLAYLEEAAASPASETVQSLAAALETSPEELLGGTVDLPPGRGPAAADPSLEKLDPNRCLHLIFPG